MTKKELAQICIQRLKDEYPLAECTLDYDHAWQLLVEVRLAAQCTDARVNVVVQDLFARYPSVEALAAATPEEIEAIVKPCGLGRSKARDISACMRMLRDKYDGKVPDDFDALLARHRYPLHPPVQPHRAGGQHQGTRQGRAGAVEDHPAGRRQRFLPPPGTLRPGGMQSAKAPVRRMHVKGNLQESAEAEAKGKRNFYTVSQRTVIVNHFYRYETEFFYYKTFIL